MEKDTAIIVPAYYKPTLTEDELLSLKQLNIHLKHYDKYFVIPDNVNTDGKKQDDFHFIKFPKEYFVSTKSYNKLLLKNIFYKSFIKYKYILIYQLDVMVFSDQLTKWCNANYDYIGAPSFFSLTGILTHKVGYPGYLLNGGLSLRKIDTFIKVLEIAGKKALEYSKNEDGFWSFEAPKYIKNYKLPEFRTALSFAFEKYPKLCFRINNNKLPFGCHAWAKYDQNFWLPFLK